MPIDLEGGRRVRIVDVQDAADDGVGLDITFEDVETGDRFTATQCTVQGVSVPDYNGVEGMSSTPVEMVPVKMETPASIVGRVVVRGATSPSVTWTIRHDDEE